MTDLIPRPTDRDVAYGIVLGLDPSGSGPAGRPGPARPPLVALERAVLPALRRSPCLVSFSGGLDSSLVLAIAARVARREGLPDPVPVTWRFTDAPRAHETPWQAKIIGELDLGRQWQILQAGDDLDLVGPVARRLLTRYGQLHPPNRHLHLPIVELARGGALLTGIGGDQILNGWRRRPDSFRARLGRLRLRRRETDPFPWLRPEAGRQARRALRAERRAEPRRLAQRIAWHLRRRDLTMTRLSLAAVAADHDVLAVSPLLSDGFTAALAARHGRLRSPSRGQLLTAIADAALPPVIVAPRRKAAFDEVFLRAATRDLVNAWDGSGVDGSLVDVRALRREWSAWPIDAGTAALVQQVWLTGLSAAPGLPDLEAPR
ncbi:asparagine synthase-related protein [Micromonospora sp. WMMC241]|uniref:asparagine synthase-related protein n=1 Tax=Micromonospora sp. WMMC241 TaxID=3015159 RepID=UPI0022B65D71|nr:asparagine synthase-related protein [Micromonospora sp. WMMC241]MCZ7436966.1 asparagine synthase-related protein [Micromonospora sp. WMMC241]